MSDKKIQLNAKKIDAIFESARKHGIGRFKLGDMEFELGEKFFYEGPKELAKDDPQQRAQDFNSAVHQTKLTQLDEMILSDPEAFEDALQRMNDESKPAEEVIVQ